MSLEHLGLENLLEKKYRNSGLKLLLQLLIKPKKKLKSYIKKTQKKVPSGMASSLLVLGIVAWFCGIN